MDQQVKLVQFTNCRLVRDGRIVQDDDLWVRNGKIVDPEKVFFDEKCQSHLKVDCKGALIAPGFIDLQINGGYGVDFSYDVDTVATGVMKVAKGLLENGVTSFCPTLVTSPPETYRQVIPQIPRRPGGPDGAAILGVHVEGPFINPAKKGAHPLECIRDYDNAIADAQEVYGNMDNIQIVTLAPEKKNGEQFIRDLSSRGITVSVGHSSANLAEGEMAVKSGATLITHLFNAMLPFHHRDPGLVGLLASTKIPEGKQIYFGIISDGVHTHPAALRIAYRAHPDGLILVTDAISALGLDPGTYRLGQYSIEVRDAKAYISGTNTLCGSIAPLDECIRIFKRASRCSLVYAIEAASLHPAKCLGIEARKGTLNYGGDADFVFLDDELMVKSTWIAGDCVFENANLESIPDHSTRDTDRSCENPL